MLKTNDTDFNTMSSIAFFNKALLKGNSLLILECSKKSSHFFRSKIYDYKSVLIFFHPKYKQTQHYNHTSKIQKHYIVVSKFDC